MSWQIHRTYWRFKTPPGGITGTIIAAKIRYYVYQIFYNDANPPDQGMDADLDGGTPELTDIVANPAGNWGNPNSISVLTTIPWTTWAYPAAAWHELVFVDFASIDPAPNANNDFRLYADQTMQREVVICSGEDPFPPELIIETSGIAIAGRTKVIPATQLGRTTHAILR